jgi:hypothetical protein
VVQVVTTVAAYNMVLRLFLALNVVYLNGEEISNVWLGIHEIPPINALLASMSFKKITFKLAFVLYGQLDECLNSYDKQFKC